MTLTIKDITDAFGDYKTLRAFVLNKEWMGEVEYRTQFLPSAKIKQRLWHIIHNRNEQILCKCGVPVKWNIKENLYRTFCSSKCAHNDDLVKSKIEATCIRKYGTKTNLTTQATKDSYAKKMIERFGVDNPFKSAAVQSEIKQHFIDEYGVSNPSKLEHVKQKITKSHEEKYGRKRESQSHYSDESYDVWSNKEKLIELYDGSRSVLDISKILNIGHSQLCVRMKDLGIEVHRNIGQSQIAEFIKSIYNGTIIQNDRKILDGKEIDIFLPEINVGFEYDGLFWHCEESSNKKSYHRDKDDIALSKNIKLFHIVDYEWNNKKEIVKSRISSILGNNKTIYARNTRIEILNRKIASTFFDENHIQGNANASRYVGLFFKDDLVAAMSFGKSRYNSSQYELIRFCNKININVVGGASKLFQFMVKNTNATEVVSFCDIRWGTGKMYEILGFSHVRDNGPSYFYTHKYKTLESRIGYQKHKLHRILPKYDKELSEWENMKANRYDRYWNSGNSVWVWSKSEF